MKRIRAQKKKLNAPPKPKVLVAMSGGVDSSVAAAILQEEGYEIAGGFIKNWSETKDAQTGECAWRGERRDALRVAAQLGIPLLTFDFESAYRAKVVHELFHGYAIGETPNPDVLCNESIKFGLFLEEARRLGFDAIATGHYARIEKTAQSDDRRLLRGVDPSKDQSYFLYRLSQDRLRHTLFPLGPFFKTDIRRMAHRLNLSTAHKPDSQGICFIGKTHLVRFLRQRHPPKPGDIVDDQGAFLGRHEGLDAFTIGQRQRIGVSRGAGAWYVAEKQRDTDRLVVVQGRDHPRLFQRSFVLRDLHWTRKSAPAVTFDCEIQVRYQQTPMRACAIPLEPDRWRVECLSPIRAVARGQSAVFYVGDECFGGGVICDS